MRLCFIPPLVTFINSLLFSLQSAFFSMLLGLGMYVFANCPVEHVMGVSYVDGVADSQYTPPCSASVGCACDSSYMPVCFNNQTYFSPCHLGCTDWNDDEKMIPASNCSCAFAYDPEVVLPWDAEEPKTDHIYSGEVVVTQGFCSEQQCGSGMLVLLVFSFAYL